GPAPALRAAAAHEGSRGATHPGAEAPRARSASRVALPCAHSRDGTGQALATTATEPRPARHGRRLDLLFHGRRERLLEHRLLGLGDGLRRRQHDAVGLRGAWLGPRAAAFASFAESLEVTAQRVAHLALVTLLSHARTVPCRAGDSSRF